MWIESNKYRISEKLTGVDGTPLFYPEAVLWMLGFIPIWSPLYDGEKRCTETLAEAEKLVENYIKMKEKPVIHKYPRGK